MLQHRSTNFGPQDIILSGYLKSSVPTIAGWQGPIWDRQDQLPVSDILGSEILRRENYSAAIPPTAFIGYGGNFNPSVSQSPWNSRTGYKPSNGAKLVETSRAAKWGSFAGTALSLFTQFKPDAGKYSGARIEGENATLHANLHGVLEVDGSTLTYVRPYAAEHSGGYYHPSIRLTNLAVDTWRFDDVRFWTVDYISPPEFPGVARLKIPSIATAVAEGQYNQSLWNNFIWYRNFSYATTGDCITNLAYDHYAAWRDPNWGTLFWIQGFHVEHHMEFMLVPEVVEEIIVGDVYTLDLGSVAPYRVTTRLYQLCDLKLDYGPPDDPFPCGRDDFANVYTYGGTASQNIGMQEPHRSRLRGYWVNPQGPYSLSRTLVSFGVVRSAGYVDAGSAYDARGVVDGIIGYTSDVGYYNSGSKSFTSFCEVAEGCVSDCLGGVFLPFKDAVDTYLEVIGDNHLETLAEIGGIADPVLLIPAFRELFLMKGTGGKLRGILGFLADAKLTYSLNLAPSISAAGRVAEKAHRVRTRIRDIYKPAVINGKFIGKIYDPGGGFDEFTVVLRTKSLVRLKEDTLLANLLPLNEWGILPSLSNLWGNIPLSFVVDWALKIGDSLSLVEAQSAILALEHKYTVGSFKISYGFPSQYLDDNGVSRYSGPLPRSGAGYSYYGRYVSTAMPVLGPTRINILGDIGVPDWSLAAALIYKILL